MKERRRTLWEVRHSPSMTARPNYNTEPLQPLWVSRWAAIRQLMGKTRHPAMGVCVCVSSQVTWKDLFTSLKINN